VPEARLQIVPPSGSEQAARGLQSGASESSRGSELRAELTQSREDLSAREAEVSELRSQLAELDEQQADSERLVQMQSSQMKALQDRLGQAAEAPAPAPSAAAETAPAAAAAPPPVPRPWYLSPLLLAGGGLVLLGGLVLALRGRRSASPLPVIRRISDDEDRHAILSGGRGEDPLLQAAIDADAELESEVAADPASEPLRAAVAAAPDDLDAHVSLLRHYYAQGDGPAYDAAARAMRAEVRSTLDPRWREAVVMGVSLSPANPLFSQAGWNAPRFGDTGALASPAPAAEPVVETSAGIFLDEPAEDTEQDWDTLASIQHDESADAGDVPDADGNEPDLELPEDEAGLGEDSAELDANNTKIELARAYLDIGDVDGARGMLEEVIAEAGPAARAEAQRLLDEIG
jgi:pilus assembly protein FimV